MNPKRKSQFASFLAALLFVLILAGSASGQIVLQDNFDDLLSGANWAVNRGSDTGSGIDSDADFAYNYANIGVPPAPHSNGTTIGMRFLVNPGLDPASNVGTFQGISASPLGQTFTGDFRIRFDAWLNYLGPLPTGATGSTQMASFGWGTSGATVQWAGSKRSVMFAASGDGGTGQDYRAYLVELAPQAGAPILPSSGVYAAGTSDPSATTPDSRNNTDPYYARFGNIAAPTAQLADYPTQTGTSPVGTFGMAWHDVRIEKTGDTVSWYVDDLVIATVPIGGAVLGGDNIFFGMFDINSTTAIGEDNLNAAIFDNITVQVIPEPTSLALFGAAVGALGVRRRRSF